MSSSPPFPSSRYHTIDISNTSHLSFNNLYLSPPTLSGLKDSSFFSPSFLQATVIPLGILKNMDLLAQSKSGTGKTCTFIVIILEKINYEMVDPQALIIVPTREIALQIKDVAYRIGKYHKLYMECFIGGLSLEVDKSKLKYNCNVICGTPGRIYQLMKYNYINIKYLNIVVIDEADVMFSVETIKETLINILNLLKDHKKQIMAFSATYTEDIINEITTYMVNPTVVRLCAEKPSLEGVLQYYSIVDPNESNKNNSLVALSEGAMKYAVFNQKSKILLYLLSSLPFSQCIVFSNNRTRASELKDILESSNMPTRCIAGDMPQKERMEVMQAVRDYKCRVLISTDVTARGLDIPNISLVINLDLPWDAETYLHRVGRTGRFGTLGVAITLVEASELEELQSYGKQFNCPIETLPDNLPSAYFQNASSSKPEITEESLEKLYQMENVTAIFERKTEDDVISISTIDDQDENEEYYEEEEVNGVYSKEWGFFVKNGYYKDGILYDDKGHYDAEGYYHINSTSELKENDALINNLDLMTIEDSKEEDMEIIIDQFIKTSTPLPIPNSLPLPNLTNNTSSIETNQSILYPPCYYKFTSIDQLRDLALQTAKRHHLLFGYK